MRRLRPLQHQKHAIKMEEEALMKEGLALELEKQALWKEEHWTLKILDGNYDVGTTHFPDQCLDQIN